MLSLAVSKKNGVIITSFLLLISIVAGALLGHLLPASGQWLGSQVDYTLLTLVGLLFFGVRFDTLMSGVSNFRFLAIALCTNFILVPFIGYGVASVFLASHPLFMVGLVIYFVAPCTDWFLGFTRLSGGNVALGTALIPINMTVQLLLYPFYLLWFTHNAVQIETSMIGSTLLQWFLLPLVVAVLGQQFLRFLLNPDRFKQVLDIANQIVPGLIGLLVFQIFAGNISVIFEHRNVFVWILFAVFTFFLLTFLLSEGVGRLFRLNYPEHALLTMTTAARNAPLMLAVTMAALPEQPLIYAALVIGMLVEFPHLTALRYLLLKTRIKPKQGEVSE